MAQEHWLDSVRKTALRATTRRTLSRFAALLLTGRLLGDAIDADSKSKKRGKKGKGKGNKNKPKKPKNRCLPEPESCSGGSCAAEPEWVGEQCEINHCEFICRQCDGDDNGPFCIRNGLKPDGTPTKVAVCCLGGESCCGSECADFESDPAHCGKCFERCRPLEICDDGECQCPANMEACPNDFNGCCLPGDFCDVFGCESGDCPISCHRPERCCLDGGTPECADVKTNVNHCGACGHACNQANGEFFCVDGACRRCPGGEKPCFIHQDDAQWTCVPDYYVCCPRGSGLVCADPSAECCFGDYEGGYWYCSLRGNCAG